MEKETMVTEFVTKDEERKALTRIKKIVETLGYRSYVGTAFEGAWEIAERNIAEDAGFSAAEYVRIANGCPEAIRQKDNEIDKLEQEIKGLNECLQTQRNRNSELVASYSELYRQTVRSDQTISELNVDAGLSAAEIMNLKAKLYDFMVKAEQK